MTSSKKELAELLSWIYTPSNDINRYLALYHSIRDHDEEENEFLVHKHYVVEGQLEFAGILFVPTRGTSFTDRCFEDIKSISQDIKDTVCGFIRIEAAQNRDNIPPAIFHICLAFLCENERHRSNLSLYIRNSLAMNYCPYLVPPWLHFLRGVVLSDDLPLDFDISRFSCEKILKIMRKYVMKRFVAVMLEQGSTDEDKYLKFYRSFHLELKRGILHQRTSSHLRTKLMYLLRFPSSKSNGKLISIEQYVDNMSAEQNYFFYVVNTRDHPQSELQKAKHEILYLQDDLDEEVVLRLNFDRLNQGLPRFLFEKLSA